MLRVPGQSHLLQPLGKRHALPLHWKKGWLPIEMSYTLTPGPAAALPQAALRAVGKRAWQMAGLTSVPGPGAAAALPQAARRRWLQGWAHEELRLLRPWAPRPVLQERTTRRSDSTFTCKVLEPSKKVAVLEGL